MATNLQIDDRLLAKALKLGGYKTKKETVNEALKTVIRLSSQKNIQKFFGKVDFWEGHDHKKLRT